MLEVRPADTKQRVQSFDVIKGFIIAVIVFGHMIFLSAGGDTHRSAGQPLFIQVAYLGLMLFFIISGYFFRPDRGFVNNTKKRVVMLGLALVVSNAVLPLILMVELLLTGQSFTIDGYASCLLSIVSGDNLLVDVFNGGTASTYGVLIVSCGHYFIQIMLVAFIIFYAVADHVYKDVRKAIVAVFVLLTVEVLYLQFFHVHLPLYIELSPIAAAFMIFGALMGRYRIVERFESDGYRDKTSWVCLAVVLAVGVLLAFAFPPGIKFDNCIFGDHGNLSVYTFYIEACLFGIIFVTVGWIILHIPGLNRLLTFLGKHTLAILVMHCFVIKLLMAPFATIPDAGAYFPEMSMLQIAVVGILTLAICSIFGEYAFRIVKKIAGSLF